MRMSIPIENLYYLLSYAWNKLQEKDQAKIDLVGTTKLVDLFAKMLLTSCRHLLKKGIDRNYIEDTIELAGIKGKLEISSTFKTGIFLKQRTICTIDEYSADILSNQIIVSTLYLLLHINETDPELRSQIREVIRKFSGITPIVLSSRHFSEVRLHRNNRMYGFIIHVCQFIFENSLPSEKKGKWNFKDFLRDESKMNSLFEAFLYNFYRIEYPRWQVKREHIKWKFSANNELALSYLPTMITDISINTGLKKYIIDAKFYREALKTRYDTNKLISSNLYQLFSYLLNQRIKTEITYTTQGMLIYPTTDEELDLDYYYEDHKISIRTVNLNTSWTDIDGRLREFMLC